MRLMLSGFAERSGAGLLDGAVCLKYCPAVFARRVPTWKLLVPGMLLCYSAILLMMLVLRVDLKCQ